MVGMTASTRPQALAALREMARALSAAWDLDTTLDLIAQKTTEVMHVDSCTIYLLDPDGRQLRLRATTGLARRALGRATLAVGEGMTGYAVVCNAPVFAADAARHPRFKQIEEALESQFRSLLALPLRIEERIIGALNVQTRDAHDFSADEIELAALIGALAAGALAKAQLYDDQKRQIGELQALAALSEVVTSPRYLDDVLDVVTEMAAQTTETAVCAIYLLDESGAHLELRSAKGAGPAYRGQPPLPAGAGIAGLVIQSGQPFYAPDLRREPRYPRPDLAEAEGFTALLAVPLSVRDRVIGVLHAYSAAARPFSARQRALLATLANQTALALENARLVTNAAVVREMHHRIKNNLQTVAMLMQLQLPEAERLDPRRVLQTNIHRVQSIAAVHEVLAEQGFTLVDVTDALRRITRMTAEMSATAERQISLVVQGEQLLLPSRAATAVTLAVNELVQNALEHAFVGRSRGSVTISVGRGPEDLIVLVRDDGVGLPARPARRLGLEIVETLVQEDLRGRIRYNRLPSGGAEISIRMPRALEKERY
jgi:two-component system, sensor histidine kinase PdtaS